MPKVKFFDNEKLIFRIVVAISITVCLVVVILNRKIIPVPQPVPSFIYHLPALNAFLNGTCSILLLCSLYFIKRKNIQVHKRLNLLTFALSSLFLISYIAYHFAAKETVFPKTNALRPLYLLVLYPHIILAGTVLPLILLSFYYGLRLEKEKHKRLTRFAFPIWLYVTVTGVIVYLMISPYYTFH